MSKIACYHQKARPHAEGKDVSFDAKIIQKLSVPLVLTWLSGNTSLTTSANAMTSPISIIVYRATAILATSLASCNVWASTYGRLQPEARSIYN